MNGKIAKKLHKSVDRSSEALEQADRMIRESPYKAGLAMLGLGLALGALAGFVAGKYKEK